MPIVIRAVAIGMVVMLAGTLPRNLLFLLNLRFLRGVPWAVPAIAAYLWFFWRYLEGEGFPEETSDARRESLRARRLPATVWTWSLLAGGFGIVALVMALRVANRLVSLPEQKLPDLSAAPTFTIVSLLLMAAPVAGIVEEAAFRGYMQGPIERRYGAAVAILVTGTMFAVAHLDFTWILWPYYVAVAAIYGIVTSTTDSILPAVVLHTAGNTYSNLDLWLRGRAEWQAAGANALVWNAGADRSFWFAVAAFVAITAVAATAYGRLLRVVSTSRGA